MTPIKINQKMIALCMTINESLSEMLELAEINKDEDILKDISNLNNSLNPLVDKLSINHITQMN